jgi:hypothetical protein
MTPFTLGHLLACQCPSRLSVCLTVRQSVYLQHVSVSRTIALEAQDLRRQEVLVRTTDAHGAARKRVVHALHREHAHVRWQVQVDGLIAMGAKRRCQG